MRTKMQKWGNRLAVRITKPFAKDAGLEVGASVDLQVREGCLVVTPVRTKPMLSVLLRKVTAANRHDEIEAGWPVGREAW